MSKSRILLVDDEPDIVETVSFMLQSRNYQVSIAAGGEEGLEKAKQEHPDLLLLDIMMPDIDGYEVCMKLKANENTKDIPIVYVTGLMSKDDEEPLQNILGGRPFLAKPITTDELIDCIEKNLKKSE